MKLVPYWWWTISAFLRRVERTTRINFVKYWHARNGVIKFLNIVPKRCCKFFIMAVVAVLSLILISLCFPAHCKYIFPSCCSFNYLYWIWDCNWERLLHMKEDIRIPILWTYPYIFSVEFIIVNFRLCLQILLTFVIPQNFSSLMKIFQTLFSTKNIPIVQTAYK